MKDSDDRLKINDKVRNIVLKEIESRESEIIDFLQDLIRIPSITGEEGKAQGFIAKKFRSMDLEVDMFEADVENLRGHPAFFETKSYTHCGYENRPNVIGQLRGDDTAKSLMLSGHIDVVSPEPVLAWKHDPWGAEIEKGKLYGRGASDMKAGIAAMIYALKSVQDTGIDLKGNVTLQTTIE
ncbi:MAG: M20/M25/M40 family metallo-hydrolase, partial [Candidatus Aenigmarchaeota archaeon]|nr:M20/M25/M40 family metallo-hydrolase [Candidatus Aenigmarchaeota archaeon]